MAESTTLGDQRRTANIAPVCLACGNRTRFIDERSGSPVLIPPEEILNLHTRNGLRCGRCGCRNCIVLDYLS